MFNHGLVEKWLWHYVQEIESWWAPNFAFRGVGDVLMSLLGRMGWVIEDLFLINK
jgi:hypothetical protein